MLNTCEDPLRNKVHEGLVGVSELESGGLLVLKLILDVVIDVEDSSLCSLVQSLQSLRMKDIEGGNVATVVSYLKGALLLLKNCADSPTDTHVMTSASNDDFTGYMRSIYYTGRRSGCRSG